MQSDEHEEEENGDQDRAADGKETYLSEPGFVFEDDEDKEFLGLGRPQASFKGEHDMVSGEANSIVAEHEVMQRDSK